MYKVIVTTARVLAWGFFAYCVVSLIAGIVILASLGGTKGVYQRIGDKITYNGQASTNVQQPKKEHNYE